MLLYMGRHKYDGKGFRFILKNAGYEGDNCILWPYSVNNNGYGQVVINYQRYYAHRYMCELVHGKPLFHTDEAMHSCNKRRCITPSHLSWGTHAENGKHRGLEC